MLQRRHSTADAGRGPLRRPAVVRSFASWLGLAMRLGLTALLVGLHGVLLVRRVADGSIADPTVALRWAASAGLIVFVGRWLGRGLRRSFAAAAAGVRQPSLEGRRERRRTLVLWLLVAVLHAAFPPVAVTAAADLAQSAHTSLPATWLVEATLVALGTLLLAILGGLVATAAARAQRVAAPGRWTGPGVDDGRPQAARPPPFVPSFAR